MQEQCQASGPSLGVGRWEGASSDPQDPILVGGDSANPPLPKSNPSVMGVGHNPDEGWGENSASLAPLSPPPPPRTQSLCIESKRGR